MDNKQAYVSPPTGNLDITVIRDAHPRVLINLDLGIPNFTVFSMTIPLVEDEPQAMSGLIAEAVHVLLDEVSNFMISTEYEKEVIVQMYATVLAAFKGMSSEADSSKEQDAVGADPTVKTFEGTFQLPIQFVNETQAKIVTAASLSANRIETLWRKLTKLSVDPQRYKLLGPMESTHGDEESKPLSDYQHKIINELFGFVAEYFDDRMSLFDNEPQDPRENAMAVVMSVAYDKYEYASKHLAMAQHTREKGMFYMAALGENTALENMKSAIGYIRDAMKRDKSNQEVMELLGMGHTGATKIQRAPKVRHIELTYAPKQKNTVNDAARVIRQYRNRSLKQQPNPMFVIVYDRTGRPSGTIALGPKFKNDLLKSMKKGSVDFSPPVSFTNEGMMKSTTIKGIPKAISVGGSTYMPQATAGVDMALYRGPQDWLVKFTDGRSQIFPGRPTFANMRRLNFPVPRNRHKWTMIPQEAPAEQQQQLPKAASRDVTPEEKKRLEEAFPDIFNEKYWKTYGLSGGESVEYALEILGRYKNDGAVHSEPKSDPGPPAEHPDWLRCDQCGKYKWDVAEQEDPYAREMGMPGDEPTMMTLCSDCAGDRWEST